jgi:hypothetical protein
VWRGRGLVRSRHGVEGDGTLVTGEVEKMLCGTQSGIHSCLMERQELNNVLSTSSVSLSAAGHKSRDAKV